MYKYRFVIGLVLGISLVVAINNVEASEKSFHASFVGTGTSKEDFSFTGTPGSYITVAGKGTQGPYTAHAVVESPFDGNTCPLPNAIKLA